jgi:hypothetical protein
MVRYVGRAVIVSACVYGRRCDEAILIVSLGGGETAFRNLIMQSWSKLWAAAEVVCEAFMFSRLSRSTIAKPNEPKYLRGCRDYATFLMM